MKKEFLTNENLEKTKSNYKLILKISLTIAVIFFIIAIIIITISATIPCSFTKCHEKAICINQPFYADCQCIYGYNGNGRDHCDECGVTYYKQNADDNGEKAVPYSWPATVLFETTYSSLETLSSYRTLVTDSEYCGGVLINRKTVLTTASCIKNEISVYDYKARKYTTIPIVPNNFNPTYESIYSVYLGNENFVYNYNELPRVYMADISSFIIHEGYNQLTLENNLAIIKLTQPVKLNRYIQIACLPNKTSNSLPDSDYSNAFIAGFGSSGNGYSQWSLQNIRIDLYNMSMCDMVHPTKPRNINKQFCAGEYNDYGNYTGNCHGDYGSAVYIYDNVNDKKKYIVTGLLSHDVNCYTNHSPGIYVRISAYLDWIKKNSNY